MHMSFLLIHSVNPLLKPHSSVPASLRSSTMLTYRMSDPLQCSYCTCVGLYCCSYPTIPEVRVACLWGLSFPLGILSWPDLCCLCRYCVGAEKWMCKLTMAFPFLCHLFYHRPLVPLGPSVVKSVAWPDFLRSRKKKKNRAVPPHHGSSINNRDKGQVWIKMVKSIAYLFTSWTVEAWGERSEIVTPCECPHTRELFRSL